MRPAVPSRWRSSGSAIRCVGGLGVVIAPWTAAHQLFSALSVWRFHLLQGHWSSYSLADRQGNPCRYVAGFVPQCQCWLTSGAFVKLLPPPSC